MMDSELKKIFRSFIPGLLFVAALWVVKFIEIKSGYELSAYGVYPKTAAGLKGIITSPFIHGDFKHLISNSVPLLILGGVLFYFYRNLAWRVILAVYLLGGFWLWLGGRMSYHIGASGLVYGITTFLFLSGILRREIRLMALSLLVVFLYGGMVWGIFPLFTGISWEAHLFGSCAGMLMAFVYRKEGPQKKVYDWDKLDEGVPDGPDAYWKIPEPQKSPSEEPPISPPVNIRYIYRAQNENPDEKN
jgi:membrane associated rhomboid family serine protease